LGVTVAVLFLFVGAVGVGWLLISSGGIEDVEDGSFLRVTLAGPITDAPVPGGIFDEPVDFPMIATDYANVIREAAKDDRITGVYLELKMPMLGWGLAREIRTALRELKEAEKPCVAYSEFYTFKDYYLASACETVLLAPGGVTYIAGMESTNMYYRGALDKLGVEPQFVHVGEYKTAVEPFERTGPSEAAIEANEALLDSMYSLIIKEIAASRSMSEDSLRATVDALNMTPEGVVKNGLIDGLAYPDALSRNIKNVGEEGWIDTLTKTPDSSQQDEDKPTFISAKKYRANLQSSYSGSEDKIAVIYAEGAIMSGKGEGGLFAVSGLFDGNYRSWMREARDNDAVKAVVVRVNSPGGSALASDMMWRELALTRAAGKPVVISMADYAASGGYMMSCNADWIVAQPTTITGSIGVFGTFFSMEGVYEKLGLTEYTFKRGERADLLASLDKFDEEELSILKGFVGSTYNAFVGQVADGRKREVAQVEAVAQGRVWTGTQAIADTHKLVDQLGGLDEALVKAGELADLTEYAVHRIPEQKGFFDLLVDEMAQADATLKVELPGELGLLETEQLLHEIVVMENIARNGGVATYLPGLSNR
jgi:protease-4